MNKISAIYKISSIINPDKFYIGSTIDFVQRKRDHLKKLRKDKHQNKKLQLHFNKYGENDLIFSEVLLCVPEELIINEQHYIDTLKPFFNNRLIAEKNTGFKHSLATKKKISLQQIGHIGYNKGAKHTKEAKIKIGLAQKGERHHLFGKTHSKETREKISIANKGKRRSIETEIKKGHTSWLKGKHLSESTREKLSIINKGKTAWNYNKKGCYTQKTLSLWSSQRKGRRISEGVKAKISQANFGHPVTKETRMKIGAVHKNKIVTEETKIKLREAWIRRKLRKSA